MPSPAKCDAELTSRPGRLKASLAALVSLVRGLPLFLARRPKTPLRVLCIMAFDTVCVLRTSRRLSSHRLQTLALLLDFGACANDFFDGNRFSREDYRTTRFLFEQSSNATPLSQYLSRLKQLETGRPSPGGDDQQHWRTQQYRESVVRLSLGMIAAEALEDLTLEEGVRATYRDEDLETLYRIVMLCQIIDDVVDFDADVADRLPSFLTAHRSPSRALTLSRETATRYANPGVPASPSTFPFRAALLGVWQVAIASLLLGRGRWWLHSLRNRFAVAIGKSVSANARL